MDFIVVTSVLRILKFWATVFNISRQDIHTDKVFY